MAQRYNLTKSQKLAYDFIVAFIDEHGFSPSFAEITAGMKLKSKSGSHRLVHALKERGWIDFLPHRARSIIILEEKENEDV